MKTGFVNGTFDCLTPAHIRLLKKAKYNVDWLIVAIDSDRRVKEKKGDTRPFFNQYERLEMLESIRGVFKVYIFDSDDELKKLIKNINPDIMMVGSDWKDKEVIGSEYAKKLEFFDRDEKYSTTKILNYYKDINK